jgi:HK97 family phage prohead protease
MPKFKSAEFAAQMGADGIVEGYASTFDRTPDSYGDVIAKGAFARTLDEWRAREGDGLSIPLLYGHNTDDPMHNIGKVTEAYEDEKGLFIHAEFDSDNEIAQYARKLVSEGRLYQFSFAYAIRDAGDIQIDGHHAYELRDLDLYEVSLVQIPANQHAVVTGVKSGRRNSKSDADELRGIREAATQIIQSIDGLLADEDEPDDPDGGPDPDANSEEPDGAKGEEQEETDTEGAEQLEQAKAYAAAILEALEITHE